MSEEKGTYYFLGRELVYLNLVNPWLCVSSFLFCFSPTDSESCGVGTVSVGPGEVPGETVGTVGYLYVSSEPLSGEYPLR